MNTESLFQEVHIHTHEQNSLGNADTGEIDGLWNLKTLPQFTIM